jgi:tRNA A37 N6-isopentenylltransferase MiaA
MPTPTAILIAGPTASGKLGLAWTVFSIDFGR